MHRLIAISILFSLSVDLAAQEAPVSRRQSYEECNSFTNARYLAECIARAEERSDDPDCSSASFWQMRMREDPMTDRKSCYVSPAIYSEKEGGLAVLVTESGIGFTTLGNEYPGSVRKIRVDKNSPIATEDFAKGKSANLLLSQLATAKFVTTEYRDWPYNLARHRRLPVCDLIQKIDECRSSIK